MAQDPTVQDILNRLQTLENNVVPPPIPEDLSDPPFYPVNANGQPVSVESLEKIPDYIRDLPTFSGDPNEVSTWISDVESIVSFYKQRAINIDSKNKYHVICKIIRRKIKGEANDALVSSNVHINWTAIKRVLLTYYGEKRDINSLDYQLMNAKQNNESLEDYFEHVNKLLSLIVNQVKTSEKYQHPEAAKALIESYNEKALDAFTRGLNGELLGQFLKNFRPHSLAEAYAYCISFQNVEFRKNVIKVKSEVHRSPPKNQIPVSTLHRIPPRIPPRPTNQNIRFFQPFQHYQYQMNRPPQFRPPQFIPRINAPPPPNFQQRQNPQMQRLPPPVPQRRERVEPMDVDPSLNTRQVNYANRPQNSSQPAQKRPRMYFAETASNDNFEYVNNDDQYSEHGIYDDQNHDHNQELQSFERYLKLYETQSADADNNDDDEEAEFNFLE